MGYTAKLVCSAELVKDGKAQVLKAEDQVTVKYATPNAGEVEVTGKVLGIQLGGVKPSANQYGPLFDGIATSTYNADKLANFREATSHYAPDAFLVEVTEEAAEGEEPVVSNVYVPVDKIVKLTVTPANEETSDDSGDDSGSDQNPAPVDPVTP